MDEKKEQNRMEGSKLSDSDLMEAGTGKSAETSTVEIGAAENDETEKNVPETEEELSAKSMLIRELVADFNHRGVIKNLFAEKRRTSGFDKNFNYPDFIQTEKIHLPNFDMELLKWKFSGSPWVVLQLHGGGYVNPFLNKYRRTAGLYAEVGKGATVLSVDYRVAPEHPYPAALEDAYTAYKWLLNRGYRSEQIIIGGDSAGGGLTLCLTHYLMDHNEPLPAGLVLMSPWTDLTASGPSYTEKYEIDPVFGNTHDSLIFDSPYIGDADPTCPYMSPLFGSFEGFPPMLIQVGTDEMLLSDSQALAEKAKMAGVSIRYSEYQGMFHVFQLAGKMMRESKKAWAEVGKFMEVLNSMKEENLEAEITDDFSVEFSV